MTITRDIRLKAAETATPDQLYLYGSEEAADKLQAILIKHHVATQPQNGQCVTAVANIVLGFHKSSELPDLLGQVVTLPFRETLSLTADLLDYLELKAPINQPEVSPDNTLPPLPTLTLSTVTTNNPLPSPNIRPLSEQAPDLKDDIAEAEAALQSLEPLRTMAHDMEVLKTIPTPSRAAESPTYSSSQNALINEAERAPMRPNNPAAGPSWTSEKN